MPAKEYLCGCQAGTASGVYHRCREAEALYTAALACRYDVLDPKNRAARRYEAHYTDPGNPVVRKRGGTRKEPGEWEAVEVLR